MYLIIRRGFPEPDFQGEKICPRTDLEIDVSLANSEGSQATLGGPTSQGHVAIAGLLRNKRVDLKAKARMATPLLSADFHNLHFSQIDKAQILTNMTSSADPVQTVEWRCLKCRNIPWDCEQWVQNPQNGVSVLDFGLELDHHDSPTALEESAATGCGLCRNLRARVLHNLSSVDDLPTGQFKLQFLMDSHVSFQIDNNFDLGFYDFLERSQSPTSLDRFSPLQTASSSSPKCMQHTQTPFNDSG